MLNDQLIGNFKTCCAALRELCPLTTIGVSAGMYTSQIAASRDKLANAMIYRDAVSLPEQQRLAYFALDREVAGSLRQLAVWDPERFGFDQQDVVIFIGVHAQAPSVNSKIIVTNPAWKSDDILTELMAAMMQRAKEAGKDAGLSEFMNILQKYDYCRTCKKFNLAYQICPYCHPDESVAASQSDDTDNDEGEDYDAKFPWLSVDDIEPAVDENANTDTACYRKDGGQSEDEWD